MRTARNSELVLPALPVLLVLGLMLALATPAAAVTHLKRGEAAPAIQLKDLGGGEVGTAAEPLRGRVLVVLFGEPYHEKTRRACAQVEAVLQDPRFSAQGITPLLVVTQRPGEEDLKPRPGQSLPRLILLDPARQAFGAYQVAVMPSVVVIDRQGNVVLAIAGLTDRFEDRVIDSLLYATGKLSAESLEQALNPAPSNISSEELRPDRVSLLGRQLARRGMDELAMEKYAQALELDPRHVSARLGMARLLLKQRRLPEAEAQFREVLKDQPNSETALLGLAYVQALRGGKELEPAEQMIRQVLARNPSRAQAHFLLGLIQEQRGQSEDAAGSYKKAAQLLLERSDSEGD